MDKATTRSSTPSLSPSPPRLPHFLSPQLQIQFPPCESFTSSTTVNRADNASLQRVAAPAGVGGDEAGGRVILSGRPDRQGAPPPRRSGFSLCHSSVDFRARAVSSLLARLFGSSELNCSLLARYDTIVSAMLVCFAALLSVRAVLQ